MATATANLAPSTSTTAQMRAIAHFIVDQLSAWGWVQTSDTGQTATDSLAAQTGPWGWSGMQIWRMNDSLQATAPVFLKIEFKSGGTDACPCISFFVGTGTNGSGTLTGQLSTTNSYYGTTATTSTTYASYASGANNRAAFALFVGAQATNTCIHFAIERSKNSSGSDTGAGIILEGSSALRGVIKQYIPISGTVKAYQTYPTLAAFQGMTSLAYNAVVGLVPSFPMSASGPVNPGNNVLHYYQPDMTALNAISATIHGSSHTYLPLGVFTTAYSNWASHSFAMLYE